MIRAAVSAIALGCAGRASSVPPAAPAEASLSLAADERMIDIPAGRYVAGSTPEERATAYDNFRDTTGSDTARAERWFEREADRHSATLPAFRIDLMPVTQAQFAEFVVAERAAPPAIDEAAWQAEGMTGDFASFAPRLVWRDGRPPSSREDHPVVAVAWAEAERYCRWRGGQRGQPRRLPTADELEKAARGDGGMAYPWGNLYEPDKLNSAVRGPGDTTPVGNYPAGASPYGVLDLAGNVYHWTTTPGGPGERVIKGSAWRDFGGLGRG
ncbi:MAG: formylglycine-generating enzyme family protein, partial [Deltaproteobacteria bacterium]